MDETLDLLTLALLPDLAPRAIPALIARGDLAEVARGGEAADGLISPASRARLRSGAARAAAEEQRAWSSRLGLEIVGAADPLYPDRLRHIYAPPLVLFVQGRLVPDEGARSLSVVGSRRATPAGRALAAALGRDLAAAGLSVVSGLARGIDTAAHEGALAGGGRTVAVLGCGLDQVYPPENAGLAEAVVAGGGALVSEFALGTPPHARNFPRRNRVLAGWGRAVVVVEATAKSGALITARAALEEGREVYAVPGHPSQETAAGVNALIRDGAVLVRSAADVAEELDVVISVTGGRPGPEDDILGWLSPGAPATLEEIRERSGREAPELLARLAELELDDRVRRLPGALWMRV